MRSNRIGEFKLKTKVTGEKTTVWTRDREKLSQTPSYIPLNLRTKTLKDVRVFDSTETRESMAKVVQQVEKDQRVRSVIKEAIDEL